MLEYYIAAVALGLGVTIFRFVNWVWLQPKRVEKFLRQQGMKGNEYRLLIGDSKETSRMYEEAYSKPISLHDDIVPRLMPNISHYYRKYGDFCYTWAGPRPRIFIMDPNIARSVFTQKNVFLKPYAAFNHTLRMLIAGLPTHEGEEWTKSRTRANPVFKLDRLKPMVPELQQCCEDTLKEWREITSKGGGASVIDVTHYLKTLVSSLLARALLSSPLTNDIKQSFEKLDELADVASLHARIYSFPGEKYLPTKINRRANSIEKFVRDTFTSMINERLKNGEPRVDENGYKDLLDVLMEELYEGTYSSKEREKMIGEVIGNLKTHFFAGFATSVGLVTWALLLLSLHQEHQDRARQEVSLVLGNKDTITSDDVAKLKYITMVINETLRVYPVSMEVTRLVAEDSPINDYIVPKGALLTFPTLMYHRNPEYWGEDAHEFKPERFAEGVIKASKGRNAFLPFGWGPRICIGMNLSLLEAKVMLAMFLREFSFEISPTYIHAPYSTFTVLPQFGCPLVVKKL